MPVIRLDMGKSITSEQKKQLIEKFTDVAVDITRIPKAAFIVFIQEYDDENCGVGGVTLDKIRKQ